MAKQEAVVEAPVQKMDTPAVDPNANFTISAGQLIELFKSMTQGSNETLAHAILEARKPYIDPRKEIDEENARLASREQMRQQEEALKYAQSVCTHIAGSNQLSELPDTAGRTSIVWHVYDVGDDIGLCTNCLRHFYPWEADYGIWRNKKSYNRQSRSGVRQFRDGGVAARKAARGQ